MIVNVPVFDHINVVPNGKRAKFSFLNYSINLPISKNCCEKYTIYFNGRQLEIGKKPKSLKIHPSDTVEFEFGEKEYTYNSANYQKNYLLIRFGTADRIRAVRDNQYIGPSYSHIYTMVVYLDHDDKSEMIGIV